nr:hypothetical protein [Tanacetum cinerariifolium]
METFERQLEDPNNLRISSSSQSANKKQEFFKTDTKKVEKKDDEKKKDMSRVKCYKCKKEGHFAKDCKKAKKVLSDSEASSSSANEKISEVNRRKFYSKPTNNNLRTSSSSQSANKKQEFVKIDNKRVEKKDDEKKRDMSRKDKDEQVLLAEDQAWMESSSDSDQEINANMHMTGNRALLTNFVEKFFGTVRFGNNDFAVIAGYGDLVIDGVDLLTGDCSLNLYTIALNEVASNSSTCLRAKASSSQSWLWHQRLSHLNFATINNLVKNNLVQGLPKMKFEKDHLCSACEQGKIHRKHHKSKTTFASNKPLYLLHMDLCGPMRIQEEVFHESSESFQEDSTSSSLNSDVQQSLEEVEVPSSNTQSVSNHMFPNVNEASTSHNVFNKLLEDAYFGESTMFHDPSNVHTSCQPYPHEKKWTKDHSLYKIIGDPKLSVHTRGQLANSCLFACLLSNIKPVNVAKDLKDANWVSAMQEELDRFARLKV